MDRRTFIAASGAGAVALATGCVACGSGGTGPAATQPTKKEEKRMPITLPPLPYEVSALEPHLSRENLELHHDKHHNAYVVNLNNLIAEGKADGNKSLEEIIKSASDGPVLNNAAQIWNHSFYWQCMKPGGGGAPAGELAAAIDRDFGSFDKLRKQFISTSVSQFGSGWGWLVVKDGKLSVTQTSNADLPMRQGETALLTCDVWEHAYYPTYKNLRQKYVEVFLDQLVDWGFAAGNLAAASGGKTV